MRKHLLTLSWKSRDNAEATLKPCELFIYGDTHHVTNSLR